MVTDSSSSHYDERALTVRLANLPGASRALFACACAERLMPVYEWFASRSNVDRINRVSLALKFAWAAGSPPEVLGQFYDELEELLPDEDDEDLYPGSALAQNAIASVLYALRTRQLEDPQDAVWAARQLYEAADYIVQQGAPGHTYVQDFEGEAPVHLALRGMESTLRDLDDNDLARLQTRARADGDALLALSNKS